MSRRILLMSDIHGNLSALNAVLSNAGQKGYEEIILLGDLIDYGPRSNEVIERIQQIDTAKVVVNLWGNHEKSIIEMEYDRFSSDRGAACAKYTKEHLTKGSMEYLKRMNLSGRQEFELGEHSCLAVHGSIQDVFWKSINLQKIGTEYMHYDLVFSGHSHIQQCYSQFYQCDNLEYRNTKRTIFINPGSVGQPRNHNPRAQYAILNVDTLEIQLCSVGYDIEEEISLFPKEIDEFYSNRLRKGI